MFCENGHFWGAGGQCPARALQVKGERGPEQRPASSKRRKKKNWLGKMEEKNLPIMWITVDLAHV